jgi:hypothetical protein
MRWCGQINALTAAPRGELVRPWRQPRVEERWKESREGVRENARDGRVVIGLVFHRWWITVRTRVGEWENKVETDEVNEEEVLERRRKVEVGNVMYNGGERVLTVVCTRPRSWVSR